MREIRSQPRITHRGRETHSPVGQRRERTHAPAPKIERREEKTIKVEKAHCLFEQSGTFKREFQSLGIPAEDYDIRNDFGETDHVVDLFAEIDQAYDGQKSIFDGVGSGDLVIAFFPCTRFECQSQMMMSGAHFSIRDYADEKKIDYAMKTHAELHRLYTLICKLFAIAIRGGGGWSWKTPQRRPII